MSETPNYESAGRRIADDGAYADVDDTTEDTIPRRLRDDPAWGVDPFGDDGVPPAHALPGDPIGDGGVPPTHALPGDPIEPDDGPATIPSRAFADDQLWRPPADQPPARVLESVSAADATLFQTDPSETPFPPDPSETPFPPDLDETLFRAGPGQIPPPAEPRHVDSKPVKKRGIGDAIGWTVLGAIIPGVGLWRAGHRVAGGVITCVFIAVVTALLAVRANQPLLLRLGTQTSVLMGLTAALLGIGVIWVIVIGVTHLALRPKRASLPQRAAGALVVGLLSFGVMAPLAFGANLAYTTTTVVSVFQSDDKDNSATVEQLPPDPWAKKARLNVLILGGDHDAGRSIALGSRTDTVILASIDTRTGATTLFSLPRQTARMPFPKDSPLHKYFPQGWYDGHDPADPEYMLNAMSRNLPNLVPKDVIGKTKYLGFDAMKLAVGEGLGLKVDYFVMVDMEGFKDFINAIGGITVNVNYRVPIGGKTDAHVLPSDYIEPGPNQHFGGRLALWYARGRYGLNDYSRMERQRCVINAVVQQAQPATVLTKYQAVAAAGKKSITTDIPQSALADLITLAERVHGTTLRSVVFQPGVAGFVSANPDYQALRKQVQKALQETAASNVPEPTPIPGATASPSAGTSASPKASTSAKPKSDSLDDACGYHPEKAAKK